MATVDDVRRIALSYPGVVEGGSRGGQRAFGVPVKGKSKGLCWEWMEWVDPKKPRVANPDVWAIRVASLPRREALEAAGPEGRYVHDPHYDNYPAVLVRLDGIDDEDLRGLIEDAWIVLG
ncbi:MAG: hypothetical protein ACKO5K_05160 [Armatimonadota bacterium]